MEFESPIVVVDGAETYRGLAVERRSIVLGGRTYVVAGLKEAADLLDEPDFAERFLKEDIAPYGLQLWPSAIMLAEHVLDGDLGSGRSAIEIGAGLGLVSLVAANHGWRVDLTDHEETSLQFAWHNAQENDCPVSAFELLSWNDPPAGRAYDRVLAADVLYQAVDHEPLLNCIDALLSEEGIALVSDPCRGVADRFADLARSRGFEVEVVSSAARDHSDQLIKGRIHILRRAGG